MNDSVKTLVMQQTAGRVSTGNQKASTSLTFTDHPTVISEDSLTSFIRRRAFATSITSGSDEGDAESARALEGGPHRKWPIGNFNAKAILGMISGRAPCEVSLNAFICNNISLELAMCKSLTSEGLAVHTPIMRPQPLICDICHHDGAHSTGQCAMVTSDKHGDTNTDPFCDLSCDRAQDRNGRPTHGLQRSQDSGAPRVHIICAKLAAHLGTGPTGYSVQEVCCSAEAHGASPGVHEGLLFHQIGNCLFRCLLQRGDARGVGGHVAVHKKRRNQVQGSSPSITRDRNEEYAH